MFVVPRPGLMQGRVARTWAASDYQELTQGYYNNPVSLFQLKTWENEAPEDKKTFNEIECKKPPIAASL